MIPKETNSFNTAVLLVLFNRTDTALKVIDVLRKVQIPRLYIFADAPRPGREQEAIDCQKARDLVNTIDWKCDVKTNFQDVNLGTRYAIGKAVNWMFEYEEDGMIFEHDCLPHPDFFTFCDYLLNYYRNNEKVMHISGDNFQYNHREFSTSYYFSRINHIWGWATWKRAWKYYDVEMTRYPEFLASGGLEKNTTSKHIQNFWKSTFDLVYNKKLHTWDYPWTLAMWMNEGVAILPTKNLVSNIGFGEGAINTLNSESILANIPTHALEPWVHPDKIEVDNDADNWSINHVFHPPIYRLAWRKLCRILGVKYKL